MSLLPTDTETASFRTPADLVTWAGLDADAWTVIDTALGKLTHIRMIASLPVSGLKVAMRSCRVPVTGGGAPRELNLAESIQVGLVWRAARKAVGMSDVDPLVETPSAPAAAAPAAAATAKKVAKTSSILDQLDETEVPLLSRAELDQAFANHVAVTGAEPNHESEPTPEQIAAMSHRVLVVGDAPYADFSVLTPYGRRVQKQMKARAWSFQPDGTFKPLEVPGPPTFAAWASCWRVYRAILFMLKHTANNMPVVTPACLEEYYDCVHRLNEDFPEAWFLVVQAEDRCRSEMLERHRRMLTKAAAENRLPMSLDFNPGQPWVGTFIFAARDSEYWAKHVVRPAQTFLARGGRSMTLEKAGNVGVSSQARQAMAGVEHAVSQQSPPSGDHGGGPKKRKKAPQQPSAQAVASPPKPGNWPRTSKKSPEHPRKWGTHYITDADGRELCFRFSKGAHGACPEPCKDNRSHGCQYCLGNHRNEDCPIHQRKEGGGGKGASGSKK